MLTTSKIRFVSGYIRDYKIKKYISVAKKLKRPGDNQIVSSFGNNL